MSDLKSRSLTTIILESVPKIAKLRTNVSGFGTAYILVVSGDIGPPTKMNDGHAQFQKAVTGYDTFKHMVVKERISSKALNELQKPSVYSAFEISQISPM